MHAEPEGAGVVPAMGGPAQQPFALRLLTCQMDQFKNIMLSPRSQTQKTTQCMSPSMRTGIPVVA